MVRLGKEHTAPAQGPSVHTHWGPKGEQCRLVLREVLISPVVLFVLRHCVRKTVYHGVQQSLWLAILICSAHEGPGCTVGSDERFCTHLPGPPSTAFSRTPVLVHQTESMIPRARPGPHCPSYVSPHHPGLCLLPSPDLARQEGKLARSKTAPP